VFSRSDPGRFCCHGLIYLRNDFDAFSIRRELGADSNPPSPGLHSHNGNRTLVVAPTALRADLLSICRHVLAPPSPQTDRVSRDMETMGAEGHGGNGRL